MARTERPAGWPGAPLARTGLLLLSTWVLAGAEITWSTTGGPGGSSGPASRRALLPLLPRAVASQWPEELVTARRGATLGHRPGPEPLPQPGSGRGAKKRGEAGGPSLAGARWSQGFPAPGKPGSARRSRREQPPSVLELGDARATALADGSKGSRPLTKGFQEEVKAPRAGGAATEELRLPSTSFALTGDSAHNQAMVHWSGHNSSVSTHPAGRAPHCIPAASRAEGGKEEPIVARGSRRDGGGWMTFRENRFIRLPPRPQQVIGVCCRIVCAFVYWRP